MKMPYVQLTSVRSSRLDWMLRVHDVPISVRSITKSTRKAIKNPLRLSVGDILDKGRVLSYELWSIGKIDGHRHWSIGFISGLTVYH